MSSWRECKLGEVAEIKTGKSNAQDSILNGIYPLFDRSQIIKQSNRFLFDDEAIIVAGEGKEFIPRYFSGKFDLHQRAYAVHKIIKAVPKFIFYAIWSNKEYFESVAVGSTVMSLRLNHFTEFPLLLPPLEEQKAIAEVLSSLDDKIDLLHRQNQTLESIAQTLFRQWFIEEAKEEWEEKPLGKITNIAIGRTPPRKEDEWFSTDFKDVKWISIKDLGNDGVFIFKTSEYLTQEAVERFNVPVIPKDTVVLSFKMTVGRVAITTETMLSNEAIAHFKFHDKTPISKEYLYLFLKTFPYDSLGSTSSIVTAINSAMIKEMMVLIPDEKIMKEFSSIVEPQFEKIRQNQQQIQTLENFRDTLLPKLLSGEVRVEI